MSGRGKGKERGVSIGSASLEFLAWLCTSCFDSVGVDGVSEMGIAWGAEPLPIMASNLHERERIVQASSWRSMA